jgi:Leucine-rich repeat (LRR) protein
MAFVTEYDEEFNRLYLMNAEQCDVAGIVYPEGLKEIYLRNCYIRDYQIPDGVELAAVDSSALRSLFVPDSVRFLYCNTNYLTSLELPTGIKVCDAMHNRIETIAFRGHLENVMRLRLNNNRLTSFPFDLLPEQLDILDIRGNDIDYQALPPEMRAYIKDREEVSHWV